jgi:CDP-6-deoxy-D-xylo-4-hexulose-3-dehydrase
MIVAERRKNAAHFLELMSAYPDIEVQEEIGSSSWFGFSLVLKETTKISHRELISALNEHGVECRPIVAGNFAKNEVVKKHMDHEIHGQLTNAEYIDSHGLFVGNHHYPLDQQFPYLRNALNAAFLGR